MLDVPTIGTVNFHNGPLPKYAGLNPYCWAIINGESDYGISWHIVEVGIDSGPILHLARFALDPRPQAVTTLIKCIREGIRSFQDEVLPLLINSDVSGVPQDIGERHYYAGKDVPYGGRLPWWETPERLDALGRALAFSPLPNMFFRPIVEVAGGSAASCERLKFQNRLSDHTPGTICELGTDAITVATTGGQLVAQGLHSTDGLLIEPLEVGFVVGQRLMGAAP
jgi:methionyl-tRNA formyltransferase